MPGNRSRFQQADDAICDGLIHVRLHGYSHFCRPPALTGCFWFGYSHRKRGRHFGEREGRRPESKNSDWIIAQIVSGEQKERRMVTTVKDLLECAKPLIFENEDAEFAYSMQGTLFLARFKKNLFAITAQHCLRNRTKESVRVEIHPGDPSFLPLHQCHLAD